MLHSTRLTKISHYVSNIGQFEYDNEVHSGVVVSTLSSQSGLDPFCVEFACSSGACVGCLHALQHPPKVQKHASLVN